MNVNRQITSNRHNDSPEFAAEPVGLMPRNYSVLHCATAKRQTVSPDPVSNFSRGSFSVIAQQKNNKWDMGVSGLGPSNLSKLHLKNTNTLSSAMTSSTTDDSSFLRFVNGHSNQSFWNNCSTTTKSSSKSLQDTFPQLFRNLNKSSPSLNTPKKTSAKTPRSTTRTSSRTPRTSKTSDSLEKDSHILIAISEGRGQARGEIGIAGMDVICPHLILCQISDTQTYNNTLTKLNVLNPIEIILPHTFCDGTNVSKLYTSIHDTFPSATLTLIHRRHFNDNKGLQQIKNICATEYASVEMVVSHKFYALCAAAALLRYVEYKLSKIFLPKSLKIEYQGPHNSTIIDVDSANRLELVKSCSGTVTQNSLLGVLNHCRTSGGVRLLRANILEPPCSLDIIIYRLECVREIVEKPEMLHSLQSILVKVNNADRLLALCMHAPQQDSLRAAELQMNYVLLLKTTLEQIPALRTALENAESEFLCAVKLDLEDLNYSNILKRILETIQDDAHIAKPYATAQYQQCFAIKQGVNGLLDVARKTYCERIEDIIAMVEKIGESCGLPVSLKFNSSRGFHMQLSSANKREYSERNFPETFIQVQKRRNSFTFTTRELIHADERCNDIRNEIQLMSNVVIFKLLVDIRDYIGCLYKLCENFAHLDMLLSFAKVSALPNFVLPKFGEALEVISSRHPILEFINPTEPVANNVISSVDSNMHIITGPNMSGKSIYIRQIVLLQIMAQIGCYVPAEEATFRISDCIFARIGFDDSIECNASTFVLEIREVQCILQTMTSKTLIIMDEICRGTSSEEGTAVAWALCENLLQSNAFIFLTTHFMLLTKLEDIYTNVRNYHFEMMEQTENQDHVTYSHRLLSGPSQKDIYGIRLAEVLGMPDTIVKHATELTVNISSREQSTIKTCGNITEEQIYLVLSSELLELLKNGHLTKEKCVQIKYKLFPSVVTSDELIEIGEIIPSTSDSPAKSMSPVSDKGSAQDNMSTAETLLYEKLSEMSDDENIGVMNEEQIERTSANENVFNINEESENYSSDEDSTMKMFLKYSHESNDEENMMETNVQQSSNINSDDY